jgi:hypothetical protein
VNAMRVSTGQPLGEARHWTCCGAPRLGEDAACCLCCDARDQVVSETIDAHGNRRFARVQPRHLGAVAAMWSGDCCGYQEINWPIYADRHATTAPVTHLTWRYHACQVCYPTWVGFKSCPLGASNEDKRLLALMAVGEMWEVQRRQAANKGHATPH